jgi:hypothetical protein
MSWFMTSIQKGVFEVINPYSKKAFLVPADLDHVHSIVFWSKNFGPFLNEGWGQRLWKMGYRFFFNFTINSGHRLLEPGVPSLKTRLDQLSRICTHYGSETVHWRFDPICTFHRQDKVVETNIADVDTIAQHAAKLGISTCITSFADIYRKIQHRLKHYPGLKFIDPTLSQKVDIILDLENRLDAFGIELALCCEKEVIEALPSDSGVQAASCIPNERLVQLYGPGISLIQDRGQRVASGCGCRVSRDIGSYSLHPCLHNCLFCYANPSCDEPKSFAGACS